MTTRSRVMVSFCAVMACAAMLTAACLPSPATREGRSIIGLYDTVLVVALAVMIIVWGLLTLAIVRYRRGRHGSEGVPPQIGGHLGLEALWTGVPLLTIFAIFGLTLLTLDDIEARQSNAPLELHVEGFRWGWRMSYPGAGVTVEGFLEPGPEAVVPAGEPLLVTLTSADVIHSFYVPQFLYKRDAVPGRTHVFELTIEQEGTFVGQCAEYCGLFHARMPFTIRSVPAAEFDAWLAAQPTVPGATP